jgi:hypothetical protein
MVKKLMLSIAAMLLLMNTAASQSAVDIETAFGESDIYILYDDGSIKTIGTAVDYGSAEDIDAVDLVLTPARKGYYILDDEAGLHTFGDAVDYGIPELGSRENVVALEVASSFLGMYFLTDEGKILAVGDAPFYGELVMDDAVDMELTNSGKGYIVLYETGELAFFGDATNYGSAISSMVNAVDLEVIQGGYYVLYEDGDVKSFGLSVQLPEADTLPGNAVALSLSEQGYRIIDAEGNILSFIRPELQSLTRSLGSPYSSIYATTGNHKPAQTTPTPDPDTPFFELADSDFEQAMIGVLPTGKELAPSISTGQFSLPSGGTFVLVGEEGALPREILWFDPTEIDAEYTGVTFATLTEERGGASITGISYSAKQGLVALIRDFDGIHLVLIQGDFEPSAISAFGAFE